MADRTVLVRLRAQVTDFNRGIASARMAVRGLHDEIDKTNDRTAWLAQGILALTPAVTSLGAGAVPVISGLATHLTLTGGAAGTMALAFNGVGDALGALNDYQIKPTDENLEKLNEAMGKIGPQGEKFVRFLDSLGPEFSSLANTARGGIFPGLTEGIEEFMTLMPQVDRIVGDIAEAIGEITADAGAGLSGSAWADFFDYLDAEAKPLLEEMGDALGGFITGFANMMVAFGPLTADFSTGLADMAQSFADWSAGLRESTGFQEFLAYVEKAGPMALDFLGSVAIAFAELAEAAAPVGAVMLPALTTLVDVIARLADTPFGPLILGFTALTSAWGRLNALAAITGSGAMGRATRGIRDHANAVRSASHGVRGSFDTMLSTWATAGARTERESKRIGNAAKSVRSSFGSMARNAAPVGGQIGLLGVAMSGLDDKAGLTNTTMLALAGSLAGPWGTAAGAAIGTTMDLAAVNDDLFDSIEQLQSGLDRLGDRPATGGELQALSEQAVVAEENLVNLANSLNDSWNPTSMRWVMSGAKNTVEGIFGRSDYEEAYEANKRAQEQLRDAATASRKAAGAQAYYQVRADEVTAAARRQAEALREQREAARKTAESFFDLTEKTDKAKSNLDDWLKELEDQADALRNFRKNAEEAGDKGVKKGLIADLRELGPEGAKQMRWLANATEKQIERANRAWQRVQDEVKQYERSVRDAGKTKLELKTEAAEAAIRRLEQKLRNIADEDVFINVRHRPYGQDTGLGPQDYTGSADGSTVPKTGKPYADRHPYLLADGEEIISNRRGQADKNRAELKAANAGAKLAVIGYADGGTTGATYASMQAGRRAASIPASTPQAGAVGIDYDRLVGAMRAARPMYGDVHVSGDGSFRRALLEDKQRAALGGF